MPSLNKKIQVFLLGKDHIGWSVDKDRENIYKLFNNSADFEITKNIFKADIIYSVWYDILSRLQFFYPLLILKKIKKIKLFATITNNIENTPEKTIALKKLIDIWVAPSLKTYNFIQEKNLKTIHLPFLIEKDIFLQTNKLKNELAEILNIDIDTLKNKTLFGSFQRDSLGSDLSKPKWQKNPALLIEILKKIPRENILLLLAGPRRHYIVNACKKFSIPYLFIGNESLINNNQDDISENNISLEKINLLYNLIDAYIVTSKSEGGPKAILEAAITKTLVFSTDVGLARDILS